VEMAEHDRKDHDEARVELLRLYEGFEILSMDDLEGANKLTGRFVRLMRELGEHMKWESGLQVPRLEALLSREESEGLARLYLETQVLGPDLVVGGHRVWRGVAEYVRMGREELVGVWRGYCDEMERRGAKL